jgi:hypothetical protein
VRNKKALDNAKSTLDSVKRSKEKALESELELEKAKFEAIMKVR